MSDRGLDEWLALCRVHAGGVAKVSGVYLDHGRLIPGHLNPVFDQLIMAAFVALAEGDPFWDLRRLSLTDTGRVRYVQVCTQRQADLPVPAPERTTPATPVGRRSSSLPPAPRDRPGPTGPSSKPS